MASGHVYCAKKAEHMAAPTNAAKRRFYLPTRSRPHMAHRVILHTLNRQIAFGREADINWQARSAG